MRTMRIITAASLSVVLFATTLSPAAAQDRAFHPTAAGREARHDGRNSDGAPRPPGMWRGHGGTMWPVHYQACRKAYGSRYDYRTDIVRRGSNHRRCSL